MPTSPHFPPMFVLAGLVGVTTPFAAVPAPELVEAQLRAINHRFISPLVDTTSDLMNALTNEDFLLTAQDGRWYDRADFLAGIRRQMLPSGASYADMRIRLFGQVAIAHGVWSPPPGDVRMVKFRCTDVYLWRGGIWQLVSAQNSQHEDAIAVRQHGDTSSIADLVSTRQDQCTSDLLVLRRLNEDFANALRDANAAWFDAHLAPDYFVVSEGGFFEGKAAALLNFVKATFVTDIKSFPARAVCVRRFDDVALVHAKHAYESNGVSTGGNRSTHIWHKFEGGWRCIASHITRHNSPTN